jgi:hypothetical protein
VGGTFERIEFKIARSEVLRGLTPPARQEVIDNR